MANILIVDDSVIMRRNLKIIIEKGSHVVVGEASNGLQAFSEYEKHQPDLVTMDITMPVMDGIEAVKNIMEAFPKAKIVMISALDQKKMVFQAIENGAKHYIMKPITSDKVLSIIDQVLKNDEFNSENVTDKKNEEVLNNLWVEIKQDKDEVVDFNKSVEKKIAERTEELEMANSQLKENLENIKESQEKLIQNEKSAVLSKMVAGVAHEINTPVGISITAISHLEERTKEIMGLYENKQMKKSDFERYIQISMESSKVIFSNLKRASELIKSFKMITGDQSTGEKRIFNMKEYMENIVFTLGPALRKAGHTVNISCDDSIEVDSNPGCYSQIITNFIMNSINHGYDENDKGNINISITRNERMLAIEYSDDGKGIKREILEKIFDPFFTTNRLKGGTGLGLNIVYSIVTTILNGTIKCESEEGNGTAFTIVVPIK